MAKRVKSFPVNWTLKILITRPQMLISIGRRAVKMLMTESVSVKQDKTKKAVVNVLTIKDFDKIFRKMWV